jgi:hypothetical protein
MLMSAGRLVTRAALVAVGVLVSVVLMAAPSWAAKPGNSVNAKLCQKGKWKELVNGERHVFQSEEECVAFGAKGGTPQPGKPNVTVSPGAFVEVNPFGENVYQFESYGTFTEASQGKTETFTLKNEGAATTGTLVLENLSIYPGWSFVEDHCSGTMLSPGATCTLGLHFRAITSDCPTPINFAGGFRYVTYVALSTSGTCEPT